MRACSCCNEMLAAISICAAAAVRTPPAIVQIQRATRELSCTFLYSGLVRSCDPLTLFDSGAHQDWWFGSGNLSAALEEASSERTLSEPAPLPPAPRPSFNSPLLEARARRATPSVRTRPGGLQTLQEPEDAEPIGPATSATDRRGGANRGLCRQQLERVATRRPMLEKALIDLLDPKVAPQLPAFDCAVLLLFMAELHEGLPLPVACRCGRGLRLFACIRLASPRRCHVDDSSVSQPPTCSHVDSDHDRSEAVDLSVAYGGVGESHRYVNGVLASYTREYLEGS